MLHITCQINSKVNNYHNKIKINLSLCQRNMMRNIDDYFKIYPFSSPKPIHNKDTIYRGKLVFYLYYARFLFILENNIMATTVLNHNSCVGKKFSTHKWNSKPQNIVKSKCFNFTHLWHNNIIIWVNHHSKFRTLY